MYVAPPTPTVDPRLDPRANSRGGNYDEHRASTEEMGGRKRRADVFTPLDQHGRPLPLLRFETLGTWRDPLGKGFVRDVRFAAAAGTEISGGWGRTVGKF